MAKIKVRYGDSWASLESNYPGIQNKNPRTRAPKAGQILQIPDPVIPIQQQKQYLFEPKEQPYSDVGKAQFKYDNDPMRSRYNPYAQPPKFTPTTWKPNGRYNPYDHMPVTSKNPYALNNSFVPPGENSFVGIPNYYTQLVDQYTANGAAQQAIDEAAKSSGGGGAKYKRGGDYVYKNKWTGKVLHNYRASMGIRPPTPQNTYVKSNRWMQGSGTPSSWRIG